MAEKNQFIALKDCRFLLQLIKLTHKIGTDVNLVKMSNAIFYFIFFMPIITMCALILWHWFDHGFAMDSSIWPFTLILSITENILIYMCLLAKKTLITDMMQELQHLISQSMFLHAINKIAIVIQMK